MMRRITMMKSVFKRFLILSILACGSISALAEWTVKDRISFQSAKEYHVIFDVNGTNYEDMDSVSFIEYYAAKNEMPPERLGTIVKYIGPEICKNLSKRSKKTFSLTSDSKYIVYIHLDKITGKAGMSISVNNYIDREENGFSFTVSIDDGRWNEFDKLLEENCEKLAKKILEGREISYRSVKCKSRSTFDSLYY